MSTALSLRIAPLVSSQEAAWDGYVQRHPHGSPFHQLAWRNCLVRTFNYSPRYLMATSGDEVRGVLPLFLTENRVTGRLLISTPFAVYGGVLAEDDETRRLLADEAARLGRELQVEHVELRNNYAGQCAGGDGWHLLDRYVSFQQPLAADDEEQLLAKIPKKTRNMVRKALKTEFEVRRVRDTHQFERLHSATLRRLGTPCFPPQHFANLVREFGDAVDVTEVWHGGKVVAASLSFLTHGSMHIYYACTDPEYNHLASNYRMYFDHLLWAGQLGLREFDFGRSKLGTGTVDFKKHWATTMRPLPYEILLVKRRELPNFTQLNPKFQLVSNVWKKLPLPVARVLGPRLVKLFP